MLKAEYSTKPLITQSDAKQHLHDVRYQRQNQLATIINECHQLRVLHKRIFDNQLNSSSTEKSFISKPLKIEPIFTCNPQTELDNELSVLKENSEYLSESSYSFLENRLPSACSNRLLSTYRKKNQQQYLSVSSVASIDKRVNKVYEKWPDHTQISQIIGHSIEKFPPISTLNQPINKTKSNKSNRFVDAIKQMKNRSSIQRHLLKDKSIDESRMNETLALNILIKEMQPKLPLILCPSSIYYSKQIQTRQWLCKNYSSTRTLPLI
ncbi:unnamed protein product [Rotaria sp. Silwood2]|nr:unnamed protein product [Rotaria sp. Silwood2]